MKTLLERFDQDSDRKKLLISVSAVALIVIAAMLLPLAFRTSPEEVSPPADMGLEARSQMFASYWNSGAEAGGFTVEKPDPVPGRMKETCETVMRTLIARSINDQALSDLTPTGTEYTVVSDADGRELRLCRMWLERRGDWQNWLDVCMDAETGDLYYFYLSRECLTNRKNYPAPEHTTAAQLAELIATENGWTLRALADGDDSATAVYAAGGGTLCFSISCRVYDALIDVKIACQ